MMEPEYSPKADYSWNFKPDREKRAFSIKKLDSKIVITTKEIPKINPLIK